MAQRHHPGAGRRQRPRTARRDLAADQQSRRPDFEPVLKEAKRRVLETMLASEFTVLTRLLARIAGGHYSHARLFRRPPAAGLELYVLHFPVYRTYVTATAARRVRPRADHRTHDRKGASGLVRRRRRHFRFPARCADARSDPPRPRAHSAPRVRRFALKIQQFTGPMMAKSLEDTALLSLSPPARTQRGRRRSGCPRTLRRCVSRRMMRTRAKEWPHGMTATATHDTKRGEDARARLLALSRNSRRMDQRGRAVEGPQRAASRDRR